MKYRKTSVIKKLIGFIRWFVIVSLIFVFTLEVGIRLVVESRWIGKDYGDVFSFTTMNEGGYLIPNVNTMVTNGNGVKVSWVNNSKGFRSTIEYSHKKPPSTIRVLSIGDSFTSGYRVGQEETYSYLLEKALNELQDSVNYEFMIANVSNPTYAIKYLNEHGLQYNPDIVLLGVTIGNDLTENIYSLIEYGKYKLVGTELIENPMLDQSKLDSMMSVPLPQNTYESGYEINDFTDRFLFPRILKSFGRYKGEAIYGEKGKVPPYHYDIVNGLSTFLIDKSPDLEEMYHKSGQVFDALEALSIKANFELKIALFPQRYQVNQLDLEKTIDAYNLKEEVFDWNQPNTILGEFCRQKDLNCMDLLTEMKNQTESLYLPGGDMHWNAKGQAVAAQIILKNW
ncbi:MAG: hypothetical protein HEP71_17165 [Roseivirga sp.]|nr:hypothetical protein [Roseivirga sp.]